MPNVDKLFQELLSRGGSDLHLAVNQPPFARVRTGLVALRDNPIGAKELEELLLEIVTPAQRARLAADLDLHFSVPFEPTARFRASYYVKQSGLAATFRAVPTRVPSLSELRTPATLSSMLEYREGLVVVAGPSGSGKTTTVAAMLDHVNKTRSCHVVTVENAIEYVHTPVRAHFTQREVGLHVPSVLSALKQLARENADVAFVPEPSSPEEFELALELASDGALVLTTMRASGVELAVRRLLRMVDASSESRIHGLLADSLIGVAAQHLLRSADGTALVPAYEHVLVTDGLASELRDGHDDSVGLALRSGVDAESLNVALERLVTQGRVAPELAFERATDREAFAHVLARIRPELVDTTT